MSVMNKVNKWFSYCRALTFLYIIGVIYIKKYWELFFPLWFHLWKWKVAYSMFATLCFTEGPWRNGKLRKERRPFHQSDHILSRNVCLAFRQMLHSAQDTNQLLFQLSYSLCPQDAKQIILGVSSDKWTKFFLVSWNLSLTLRHLSTGSLAHPFWANSSSFFWFEGSLQ